MVNKVKIGVVGIQGAISEHIHAIKRALEKEKIHGDTIVVKQPAELNSIDALIIPGGESTTISRFLYQSGLHKKILEIIERKNLPVMGTCAGCVLLAKKISNSNGDVKLLNLMNVQVKRNAFGRQKVSFEKQIQINGFDEPYTAVFIRAPAIEKTWNNCEPLAKIGDKIVMAQQGNLLAIPFHPELTDDLRILTPNVIFPLVSLVK